MDDARERVVARGRHHRRERLRSLRSARERQGIERPIQRRRRLHPDRPDPDRRGRYRPGEPAPAHLGQRRSRAGRHDRRPHLPARPDRRRPVAALHPRDRRPHPHRHTRRLVGPSSPATSSRCRWMPGPCRPDGCAPPWCRARRAFDAAIGSLPRRRRPPARRGMGLLGRGRDHRRGPGAHRRAARETLPGPRRRPQRTAAQARAQRCHDRRGAPAHRGQSFRRHGQHPALPPAPRRPLRRARRRLQRPETRVRRGRGGRGPRHRGPRRNRIRHTRRHPGDPRPTRAAPPPS